MALFGGKPDHPMADIKEAKQLIAELPANDPFKTLEEITFWLDLISRTPEFKADYRYELLDLLDQAAKSAQRKLSVEYLAVERQKKAIETRLWKTVFEFWKSLGDGYNQCIEQYQAGGPGSSSLKKDLAVLVARAIRTLTLQLKWVLLRYGAVDDRIWGDLGRIYQFAEGKGIATTVFAIYPGTHGQSSVQREFLRALMLNVSATDGLSPVKQEIAERAVAHFTDDFRLQENREDANYYFDLAMRQPAARLHKSTPATTTMRFFSAEEALPKLHKLMKDIRDKDGIPSDVNLGGNFNADLVITVLQHLSLYWSDKTPERSSERRHVATRLTVVHGFQDMVGSVSDDEGSASMDFSAASGGGESWIVENMSAGGYGAIVPQVKSDWVSVGGLLAVKTETAPHWGAGVIRRITRDQYQQRRVGIQLLSKVMIPVQLAPSGDPFLKPVRNRDPALLLSSAPDSQGEVELLLRVGSYTPTQSLEMQVRNGRSFLLVPSKLLEGGDDYDWARFKIMSRAAA